MTRNLKNLLSVIFLGVLLSFSVQVVGMEAAQAAIISRDQEIAIGRDVARQAEQKYGLVNDQTLQSRITRIGTKLAAVSDRPDMPYTFKVLNGQEINAFAAPGGPVYLFKGLVDAMPSDDELAGILGHEIAHIAKRHTVVTIERNMAGQFLFTLIFGNKAPLLQDLAFSAIMAGYSRSEEDEADKLGLDYTIKAGFNPYSLLLGMVKLRDLSPDSGGVLGDVFSDHPNTNARIANITKQLANDFKVHPAATDLGKSAQVSDGVWNLPPVYSIYRGYNPLMRSYFTAGTIYRLSQLIDYGSDKFYLSEVRDGTAIFYENWREPVAIITNEDAQRNGMSANDMAILTQTRIRDWIN